MVRVFRACERFKGLGLSFVLYLQIRSSNSLLGAYKAYWAPQRSLLIVQFGCHHALRATRILLSPTPRGSSEFAAGRSRNRGVWGLVLGQGVRTLNPTPKA